MTSLSVSTLKADTLDCSTRSNIVAGNTAAASDVKTCMDNIVTWSTNITDTNIKSGAAIDATKISGTALTLSGSQTVTGNKTFNGDVDFGDAATDTVTFTSAIDSNLVFEGATADGFETTFSITDPTADRTLTMPDADVDLTGGLGQIVQIQRTQDQTERSLSVSSGFGQDDTIPQNTEGAEYTQLATAITPTSANNTLLIEVEVQSVTAAGNGAGIIMALFQDSTANALASAIEAQQSTSLGAGAGSSAHKVILRYSMTSGTTSSTTFKVRIGEGSSTNNIEVNVDNNGNNLGNTFISSMTITEIKA